MPALRSVSPRALSRLALVCLAGARLAAAAEDPVLLTIPAARCFINYTFGAGMSLVFGATDAAGPVGLATDGDLLCIEFPQGGDASGSALFAYRASDGPLLDLALAGDWLLLGDRIVAFAGDSEETWAESFLHAEEAIGVEALRDLRVLLLSPDPPPELRLALARLAAEAGQVDTLMVKDLGACEDMLRLFRPRQIVLQHPTAADLARLADVPAESLFLADPETLDLSALARLPRLRSVVITGPRSGDTLRLPRRGPSLERLLVYGDGPTPVARLDAHQSLRLLALTDPPQSLLRQVRRLPSLEGLFLTSSRDEPPLDLSPLAAFTGLRLLGLQGPVSQADVDRLLTGNADIDTLQLIDCKSVTDLSAVRWLVHLRALVCRGSASPDAEVLAQLPHLRLLALGSEEFEGEKAERLVGLAERLPGVRIAPIRGLCLGSGLILLLLPIAAVALWLGRRWERRRER